MGLLALALGIASPLAEARVSAQRAVQLLNAQRAANGLPADLVERPDWSTACALHNNYMAKTGDFGHGEEPTSPFYTEEGAWAGAQSVLSRGGADWEQENPFETAPLHLEGLLTPHLAELGVDDTGGFICATTWPGITRPDPSEVVGYSYPGDGRTGVPASEVAAESPFVPGDFVGLPEGTETGPYLMAFLDGPTALIRKATVPNGSLTGPDGPVAIEVVSSAHPEVGPYTVPPMAFVIPRSPLKARAAYHASVTFSYGGSTKTVDFGFVTEGKEPYTELWFKRDRVCADSDSPATVVVAVSRRGSDTQVARYTLDPDGTSCRPYDLGPGYWRFCGAQESQAGYDPWFGCKDRTVYGQPVLKFGRPRVSAGRVEFPLRAQEPLVGQNAKITVRRFRRACGWYQPPIPGASPVRTCGLRPAGSKRFTETLAVGQEIDAGKRPKKGGKITVKAKVKPFEWNGAPYRRAKASRTFKR